MRKGLEIIGLVLLAVLLGVSFQAVYGPQPLPQQIPTHFNAGERRLEHPDGAEHEQDSRYGDSLVGQVIALA